MFRTILVPLDGSPFAEQALPWALSLARRAGARLDLVRGHSLYALKEHAAARAPLNPVEEAQCKQEEQLYLDGTAQWLTALSPVETTTALVRAIPGLDADGILERGHADQPDLIVMACHGHGSIARFLLGSTSDEIVRRSGASALLVRPRDPAPGLIPEPVVENILIPLDGSSLAEEALAPAADLARLLEAKCILLRIVAASSASQEAEARAYLTQMGGDLRDQTLEVQERVVVARGAGAGVVEEARKLERPLIALATHGRGGIQRMLLGSVADKVVQDADCPVLVYRPAP